MKRLILLTINIILTAPAFTQYSSTLSVSNPSCLPEAWYNNTTFIYMVMTSPGIDIESQQVIIKATLKTTDGAIVGMSDLSKMPRVTIGSGTQLFYARDLFPSSIFIFNGRYSHSLNRTAKLPAGTYTVEVQLVQPGTYAPITEIQRRSFHLQAPQLPNLIMPLNEDSLEAKRAATDIIFRWTPLIPKTSEDVYYRLQVFEIYPGQKPLQALRGNQPLLDQTLSNQTQYIWHPQMDFINTEDSLNQKFIWCVQTLNEKQHPYVQIDGNGESRSQPFIFEVKKEIGRKKIKE